MKKTILFIVLAMLCQIFRAKSQVNSPSSTSFYGQVIDERGNPLIGATIQSSSTVATITDKEGNFLIRNASKSGIIVITHIGYESLKVKFTIGNKIIFQLHPIENSLNEVQVIGYGQTTKRLNTGSSSTLKAVDIQKQPVTNILSALSGRIAGVNVQTTNGLPGGNVNIQIRGTGSIAAGTNPLYIVDGIPYGSTIGTLSPLSSLSSGSINGAVSPLNNINPDDIESITVLKDADATAIYGSRGSNGVILITTKKGKNGKTVVDLSIKEGFNKATNLPRLLNSSQFQQIRQEAFVNDGQSPSSDPDDNNYAPDLTTWKNLATRDWAKYLLGGTGHFSDVQTSIQGGGGQTTFLSGLNYHSEKTYLPGDNLYQRGSVYANIEHRSLNQKLSFQLSNSLTFDNNQLVNPSANIASDILLPPNYPVYDETGNYNFYAGENPVAELNATSRAKTNNVITNLLVRYAILKDLGFKISTGYNRISIDQTQIFPSSSLYPGTINYTNFGKNSTETFIVEPQLDYSYRKDKSTISLLAGGTYQSSLSEGQSIVASGYSSEALMQNLGSASSYVLANTYTQYKYASLFGRVTYNLSDKYVVNGSIRQDASSRFGPNNRTGTFGAVGAAWIWSEEDFIKSKLPFISYGKFRGSYGITGNDQITDYQYLSTYNSSGYIYQGIAGLKPARITNADFHWESTKKLDLALELGFFANRVMIDLDRYQNRSSDQLVSYTIPTLTGFSSYQANLPAVVQNTGWELELNTKNIVSKNFKWTTTFNLTIPRNKLVSFQNLATSSYAKTLVIGEDITRVYGYLFSGLNSTGQALYATQSGQPSTSPSSATDAYYTLGKRTPDLYGGFGNTLSYKNWTLDIFGQFAKQATQGNLTYIPGAQGFNNYVITLNRWTTSGQATNIPKASNINDFNFYNSSANYFQANYLRIKNVALSYDVSKVVAERLGMNKLRLFLQGQNLLTFWNKNLPLIDPESGPLNANVKNLPPVKSFVIGIQTTF
jgi:TonB-linked SusC/RagA family outer membrane protein